MPAPTKSYLQTGQAECHDPQGMRMACAGSGQDAEVASGVAWRAESRFRLQDSGVLDTATGLCWLRDAGYGEFPRTWQEGFELIAQINQEQLLGKRDWRLPNRRELRSLISHQTSRPALPEQHPFENLFHGWYWTSTTAAISPAHAWYVDLGGGRMFYGGKDQSFMVWPVRGPTSHWLPVTGQRDCYDARGACIDCAGSGQDGAIEAGQSWPEPRFRTGSNCVIDRLTGLCWHRCANLAAGEVNWAQALCGVAALNSSGGRGTWRLPNINELETLVDCSRARPALAAEAGMFDSLGTVCWSSTTSMYEPDWAWALYLDKGAVGVGHKQQARFSAWAVCVAAGDTGGLL